MLVAQTGGSNTTKTPPAGWTAVGPGFGSGGVITAQLYISHTASGPQTITVGAVATGANVLAVIVQYGSLAPLSGANNTFGASPLQAPASTGWAGSTLNLEIWVSQASTSAIAVTTNVNNPTTRVSGTGANGGILWADFPASTTVGPITGDTVTSTGSVDEAALSQGIG